MIFKRFRIVNEKTKFYVMKDLIEFFKRLFRHSKRNLPFKDNNTDQKRSKSLYTSEIKNKSQSENAALSNQEINFLIEKAESHINSDNLKQALQSYTQIIDNTKPESHFFKRRAWINRMLGEFDTAIVDMDNAIKLAPDDATCYWERGACYAHQLSQENNINKEENTKILKKILADYKSSVERDPTSSEAWLAILETEMLLHFWDEAISTFGSCKPYISSKEYQVVRSWLGCLALVFADEEIEEEDIKSLNENTIRLRRYSWCVSEIDSLLIELRNDSFSIEKLKKAENIHKKFLDHFDEEPLRFKG